MTANAATRAGEYADRGDYHRHLDPSWRYYPVYVEKMARVRAYLDALPPETRILDLGCGEGLLVEDYRRRGYGRFVGLDRNYGAAHVVRGDLTALPFGGGSQDRVLSLDVLEHLPFEAQAPALGEMARVLAPEGRLLLSLPNLAHFASRVAFLAIGRLIRTSAIDRHPGDRPIGEFLALARHQGLVPTWRRGIFPTYPLLAAATALAPGRSLPLHRLANRLRPPPGHCFLNLIELRHA